MPAKISFEISSSVEKRHLLTNGEVLRIDPTEKIGVLVCENFPLQGKLTALRFLEWVQKNPGGTVSLPTGKTPEHFIRWTSQILEGWNSKEICSLLEDYGIDPAVKPDIKSLSFFQIDEFYPIDPNHENSFHYYINRYYIKPFGFDKRKIRLIDGRKIGIPDGMTLEDVWAGTRIDLSLRFRNPKTQRENLQKKVLLSVDEWCRNYEEQIRESGGIGFFLGGIGPDGHIGFNVAGSDYFSTTRLTETNYETQAASAADLGGIEISRNSLVITIGLATITSNPDCTAIIIAAGDAKARVVRNAVEEDPSILYPAGSLHKLPNARFYLTPGSAKLLSARKLAVFSGKKTLSSDDIDDAVLTLSGSLNKKIEEITDADLRNDPAGSIVLQKAVGETLTILKGVRERTAKKMDQGTHVFKNNRFLHTSPHHDDDMLGYLPWAIRHFREASNNHTFAYLTSGFNAVTNSYMESQCRKLTSFLESGAFLDLISRKYFIPDNPEGRNRDIWQYLDGTAAGDPVKKEEGESRRLFRILVETGTLPAKMKDRVRELIHYFRTQYPGKKDTPEIQRIKGMVREWEAEVLWGYFGFDSQSVRHLRLSFYKGDIFNPEPGKEDVLPVLELLRETRPDVVTLAFDPEGSGPDTHYKCMQALAEALKLYETETGNHGIKIWGYRNVWYRFQPSEADVYIPSSLNTFSTLHDSFMNAFGSQKEASFPSYEYEGPFCDLAQRIQVEQYCRIKTALGRDFFYRHESPLIKATRGLVFLKTMDLKTFYRNARELQRSAS